MWDFNIAADLQELSKIQIYVDMCVIEDILKTNTQKSRILRIWYIEGRRDHF